MKRKRNNQTLITSFDGYFPAELLTEVLTRLPVKSLLRFRCVSISWCNQIDSSKFISMHLSRYKNMNEHAKYCHIATLEREADFNLRFTTRRSDTFTRSAQLMNLNDIWIYGSIDGFILISPSFLEVQPMLWNPSVKRALVLPRPPSSLIRRCVMAIGFGPLSNDYKVVILQFDVVGNLVPGFGVLGLKEHDWRRSTKGMDVTWSDSKVGNYFVSVKGVAHWLISRTEGGPYTHVVSFDFDAEEVGFMEIPDCGIVRWLFLLGDSVAVLGMSSVSICIWIMNKDKDGGKASWTKWYSGDSTEKNYDFFLGKCHIRKSLYMKNGVFLMIVGGEPISYNIRSHKIRYLAKSIRYLNYMDIHVESLLFHTGLMGKELISYP